MSATPKPMKGDAKKMIAMQPTWDDFMTVEHEPDVNDKLPECPNEEGRARGFVLGFRKCGV